MRNVLHQKIEQVFGCSPLWTNLLPVKIFGDLISFIGEHSGNNVSSQLVQDTYMTINKSFESFKSFKNNTTEGRDNSSEHG